jgi:hypothetical protein
MSKITKSAITLISSVLVRAKALGLSVERDLSTDSTLPEVPSGNYAKVFVDGGNAAMIIPTTHAGKVKWCDLHIEWKGKKGYMPLSDSNGTVVCRVDPSQVDLDDLLTSLSGASRPEKKKASKAASKATDEMLAMLKTLGIGDDSEDDSETPAERFEEVASEEAFEIQ